MQASSGSRKGIGGRPRGEPTTVIRLPLPVAAIAKRLAEGTLKRGDVSDMLSVEPRSTSAIPLVLSPASCGFPSPADDYLDRPLDFNELLVSNSSATFAVRIAGDSMRDAGIFPGDLAIVDHASIESEGGWTMCGRFTQRYTWAEVQEFLNVFGQPLNLRPRYNIAPTTDVDVVRLDAEGRRELVRMRWGLVPFFWSKPLKAVPATFNARAETVHEKPMFREAFRRRRCIIPASGFYEWTGEKGSKTPHLFTAADASPILAFAGLWDRWRDKETGEEVLSCTMVVGEATSWMAPYHDRMPVMLTGGEIENWLTGKAGKEVLRPAAESALREWIVSSRVNKTGAFDDDPTLTGPLAA